MCGPSCMLCKGNMQTCTCVCNGKAALTVMYAMCRQVGFVGGPLFRHRTQLLCCHTYDHTYPTALKFTYLACICCVHLCLYVASRTVCRLL